MSKSILCRTVSTISDILHAPLVIFTHTLFLNSVHYQRLGARHDPVLQAIQIYRTLFEE